MHQKERYEEIITGKIDALPLPDMADAIWARIERQLDLNLPTDEGGGVPEPPSPWNGGGGIVAGAGFLAFIGALLTIFYYQPTQKQNTLTPPAQTQPATPVNTNAFITRPAGQRQTWPQTKKMVDTDTSVPLASTPVVSPGDIDLVNPPPDSTDATVQDVTAQAGDHGEQPLQLPGIKPDSIPKKRRGVQNIGDQDYRIAPKKNNDP